MKKTSLYLLCTLWLWAGDYDFDMSAIEVKPYTFSGYIKGELKQQYLNEQSPSYSTKNKDSMQTYLGEANLKFAYFKDWWKIDTESMVNYSDIDGDREDSFTLAQFYAQFKIDVNHVIEVGKKAPKWGKGYFANPIAFFDRKKNPDDPEGSREGYIMANYRYNKSYSGNLQNITFDILGLKKDDDLNDDFEGNDGTYIGAKLYMLYYDTDIEFLYMYASDDNEKVGFDISKNLQTNLEVHGEVSKTLNSSNYSYLVGLKYLTQFDMTITSEFLYQKEQSSPKEPFWDNRYFISKLSQKEPLDILYSTIYYKNSWNMGDDSMQNIFGVTYAFKNDILLDTSYVKNDGKSGSEYGSKMANDMLWMKISWFY